MKKVWAALLALLMMGAALCGCSHPRVEFDTVRITHEYLEGERLGTMSVPVSQVSIEISDFEIMDELWDLYTDLEILHNNSLGLLFFPGAGPNPPMDFPRYCIEFLYTGEVVGAWAINHSGVVSGKQFGKGNKVLKDAGPTEGDVVSGVPVYDRITELFDGCNTK